MARLLYVRLQLELFLANDGLAAVDQEGTSESAIRNALHIAFSWEPSCPGYG
jgi:hypothetical protein